MASTGSSCDSLDWEQHKSMNSAGSSGYSSGASAQMSPSVSPDQVQQESYGRQAEHCQVQENYVNVLDSGLKICKPLFEELYVHQIEGIAFLYGLYRDGRKGGILADSVGLGKSLQIIAFLSGMFDAELVKSIILIIPKNKREHWLNEFKKWTPDMSLKSFYGVNKKERTRNLDCVQKGGGVLFTTYQTLVKNSQQLSNHNDKDFVWDYIILDEAQKIQKPSSKTAMACSSLSAKNRIVVINTPIQNHLKAMWTLCDFACQGTLLGTLPTFTKYFENPISKGRGKYATADERTLGEKIFDDLMNIIKPFFLRRLEGDLVKEKASKQHSESLTEKPSTEMPLSCLRQMPPPEKPKPRTLPNWKPVTSPVTVDLDEQINIGCHMDRLVIKDSSGDAELPSSFTRALPEQVNGQVPNLDAVSDGHVTEASEGVSRQKVLRIASECEVETTFIFSTEKQRVYSPFMSPSAKGLSASTPIGKIMSRSGTPLRCRSASSSLLEEKSLGARKASSEERQSSENEERQSSENEERQSSENEERQSSENEERQSSENEEGQSSENEEGQSSENEEGQSSENEEGQSSHNEEGQSSHNEEPPAGETSPNKLSGAESKSDSFLDTSSNEEESIEVSGGVWKFFTLLKMW